MKFVSGLSAVAIAIAGFAGFAAPASAATIVDPQIQFLGVDIGLSSENNGLVADESPALAGFYLEPGQSPQSIDNLTISADIPDLTTTSPGSIGDILWIISTLDDPGTVDLYDNGNLIVSTVVQTGLLNVQVDLSNPDGPGSIDGTFWGEVVAVGVGYESYLGSDTIFQFGGSGSWSVSETAESGIVNVTGSLTFIPEPASAALFALAAATCLTRRRRLA